jgi:AbrB family looped-hinge helix DNA binding protein
MGTARIYSKGQITIPKAIREATGLQIGDRVVVEAHDDAIVVRRAVGVLEFAPPHPRGTDLPWPQMRSAAREDHVRRQSDARKK